MSVRQDSAIYRDLMRFKPEGASPNAWAVQAGVSRTVWADMRRHGNPSRRTLEKLLAAAGSSLAEFEALRVGRPSGGPVIQSRTVAEGIGADWRGSQAPSLPVLATETSGPLEPAGCGVPTFQLFEKVIASVPRPPSLADDRAAFAMVLNADSMWPRFRPGRMLAVSPAAAVAAGDDVLVRLHDGADPAAFTIVVAELVSRTEGRIMLRQFNPAASFTIPASAIGAVQKVLGELI